VNSLGTTHRGARFRRRVRPACIASHKQFNG
jgi:hypothetical protein